MVAAAAYCASASGFQPDVAADSPAQPAAKRVCRAAGDAEQSIYSLFTVLPFS